MFIEYKGMLLTQYEFDIGIIPNEKILKERQKLNNNKKEIKKRQKNKIVRKQ